MSNITPTIPPRILSEIREYVELLESNLRVNLWCSPLCDAPYVDVTPTLPCKLCNCAIAKYSYYYIRMCDGCRAITLQHERDAITQHQKYLRLTMLRSHQFTMPHETKLSLGLRHNGVLCPTCGHDLAPLHGVYQVWTFKGFSYAICNDCVECIKLAKVPLVTLVASMCMSNYTSNYISNYTNNYITMMYAMLILPQ